MKYKKKVDIEKIAKQLAIRIQSKSTEKSLKEMDGIEWTQHFADLDWENDGAKSLGYWNESQGTL